VPFHPVTEEFLKLSQKLNILLIPENDVFVLKALFETLLKPITERAELIGKADELFHQLEKIFEGVDET
jgi:hypothetical protein